MDTDTKASLCADDPSRQYQPNSDILYYTIPHGCLLTELTQNTHILEVITQNKQDIPYTEDVEGPPDQESTKEIQEQVVKNEHINDQSTEKASGNNTKTLVPIIEILVLEAPQSQTIQHVTSSYLIAQDRWSRARSASECTFVDFLSEIEPKKLSEALKHPGWIDAMQEELNQFYRNKVWTLIPLLYGKIAIGSKCVFRNKKGEHGIVTKNKARLVAQGYNQEERIDYDETFIPVVRMEAIRIFLAFATYMNFIVFQTDVKSVFLNGKLKEEVYVKQPLGFESSEFPDYV
ncbi:retrovirus-related pol polyprotein from transposon TNT 1-94, partial [Tanacetum coccineum]